MTQLFNLYFFCSFNPSNRSLKNVFLHKTPKTDANALYSVQKSADITIVRLIFHKGIKEYEGQLKNHVNKQVEPVMKELKEAVHKTKGPAELEKKLANVIRHELRQLSIQTPVAHATPSPGTPNAAPMSMAEIQAKIRMSLGERNFNDAFATALSANNLAIVVATCEMVNIEILNQVPCPLSQEVLLSLIQQLGKSWSEREARVTIFLMWDCDRR